MKPKPTQSKRRKTKGVCSVYINGPDIPDSFIQATGDKRRKLAKAIADMLFNDGEAKNAILSITYTSLDGWGHKEAAQRIEQLLKKHGI